MSTLRQFQLNLSIAVSLKLMLNNDPFYHQSLSFMVQIAVQRVKEIRQLSLASGHCIMSQKSKCP